MSVSPRRPPVLSGVFCAIVAVTLALIFALPLLATSASGGDTANHALTTEIGFGLQLGAAAGVALVAILFAWTKQPIVRAAITLLLLAILCLLLFIVGVLNSWH